MRQMEKDMTDEKGEQFIVGNFALKNLSRAYHGEVLPFDITLQISDGNQVRDVYIGLLSRIKTSRYMNDKVIH